MRVKPWLNALEELLDASGRAGDFFKEQGGIQRLEKELATKRANHEHRFAVFILTGDKHEPGTEVGFNATHSGVEHIAPHTGHD